MGFTINSSTSQNNSKMIKPYLEELTEKIFSTSSNGVVIEVNGDNFDTDTIFYILDDTSNNIELINVLVKTPRLVELTINTGTIEGAYSLGCKNKGNEHFNNFLTFNTKNITILIPGVNGVVWENIVGSVIVSEGIIETTGTSTSWNKQATFGSIPANTDGELSMIFAGTGTEGSGASTAMMGLGVHPTANSSYTDIDYAMYINGGSVTNYENGGGSYSLGFINEGDKISIKRIGTEITYYVNDNLARISLIPSTEELHFDCSLYRNMKLTNIKITY